MPVSMLHWWSWMLKRSITQRWVLCVCEELQFYSLVLSEIVLWCQSITYLLSLTHESTARLCVCNHRRWPKSRTTWRTKAWTSSCLESGTIWTAFATCVFLMTTHVAGGHLWQVCVICVCFVFVCVCVGYVQPFAFLMTTRVVGGRLWQVRVVFVLFLYLCAYDVCKHAVFFMTTLKNTHTHAHKHRWSKRASAQWPPSPLRNSIWGCSAYGYAHNNR